MSSFIVSLFSLIWTRFLRAFFMYLGSYFITLGQSAHIIFREVSYYFVVLFVILHIGLYVWWRIMAPWFALDPYFRIFHIFTFMLGFAILASWRVVILCSLEFIPSILDLWRPEPIFTRAPLLVNTPPNPDLLRVAYNANLDSVSVVVEPPTQEPAPAPPYRLSPRSFCLTRVGLALIVGGIVVGVISFLSGSGCC